MIAMMEAEIVRKHKWLTHSELADIIAIAESTPGPIAVNIATFLGVKKLGVLGGIFTTIGVCLPAFIIILALSYVLNLVKDNKWVEYLFKGIRIGVLVIIFSTVVSFIKDMKKGLLSYILMIAAFLITLLTNISVIYVILASIIISALYVTYENYKIKYIYHWVGTNPYYSEYKYPDGNANDNVYRRMKEEKHD